MLRLLLPRRHVLPLPLLLLLIIVQQLGGFGVAQARHPPPAPQTTSMLPAAEEEPGGDRLTPHSSQPPATCPDLALVSAPIWKDQTTQIWHEQSFPKTAQVCLT